MVRRSFIPVLIILAAMLLLSVVDQGAVRAEAPNAWATVQINLRSGPGTQFAALGTLPVNTPLVLEARNSDTSWVLVHTVDRTLRGWAKTTLLKISRDVSVYHLPGSDEQVTAGVAPGSTPVPTIQGTPWVIPTLGPDKNLSAPVVPVVTSKMRAVARQVLAKGRALGNNPRVFSKVGDCMTDHWAFLNVFSYKRYDLGKYGSLQGVIDYFSVSPREGVLDSFVADSRASHNGFNSAAVLDYQFNNVKGGPALCNARESALECEFRVSKPSVAIIMFGTADVAVMTPAQFNFYLRYIVRDAMDHGVLPLLSTFPENKALAVQSRQINQIVLTIGKEKSLPVMNLQEALKDLPNNGIDNDGIHLTIPPGEGSGYFTDENLKYGYTVRNLVTLQALDVVWRQLMR